MRTETADRWSALWTEFAEDLTNRRRRPTPEEALRADMDADR